MGQLVKQPLHNLSAAQRFFYFWGSQICITVNIYPSASSKRRDPSTLTGYLEWWNWRVQVSLAHLVTWHLGPVVHRRKSAHKPPGESGGQWGCTPTDGYIAQLLLVECGAGRPKKTKQNKQGETGCLGTFRFFADQKQVRAIKPLIAQQAGTNLWFVLIKVLQ